MMPRSPSSVHSPRTRANSLDFGKLERCKTQVPDLWFDAIAKPDMLSQSARAASFKFEKFGNLDVDNEDTQFLINSMDVMVSLDSIREIKEKAIKDMHLRPNDIVLEVGCGHGEDARAIAQKVRKVIAIDTSKLMIEEAEKRSKQLGITNVDYHIADAKNLMYKDNTFSGCHADRLLVSDAEYNSMFKEIIRVVKPGGVISFTDVDAASIIICPQTKATKVILNQILRSFVNPEMGRNLKGLFIDNNLEFVKSTSRTSTV